MPCERAKPVMLDNAIGRDSQNGENGRTPTLAAAPRAHKATRRLASQSIVPVARGERSRKQGVAGARSLTALRTAELRRCAPAWTPAMAETATAQSGSVPAQSVPEPGLAGASRSSEPAREQARAPALPAAPPSAARAGAADRRSSDAGRDSR